MQIQASSFRLLVLGWVGVMLAACGSGSSTNPTNLNPGGTITVISESMSVQQAQSASENLELQGAAPERQAVFDFSATVSDGPSKDSNLSGKLTVELKRAGQGGFVFMGALVDAAKLSTPAKGVLTAKGKMFLFLETNKAAEEGIIGMGQKEADGNFSGGFIGPKSNDRGSWTAKVVSLPTPPSPAPEVKKSYNFSATIVEGVDKDKMLEGSLNLISRQRNDEGLGELAGMLKLNDGSEARVRGSLVKGRNQEVRMLLVIEFKDSRLIGEGKTKSDNSLEGRLVLIKRKPETASQAEGKPTPPTGGDGKEGIAVSKGTWTATPVAQ